jgi:hypothetical protein
MITLDPSLLTSYYTLRSGGATGGDAAASAQMAARKRTLEVRARDVRAAPWVAANQPTDAASKARLQKILDGQSLAAEGPMTASGARRTDQQQLFGAFRVLEGLRLIAERAQTNGVPEAEIAQLQERFRVGVKEVSAYLGAMDLQKVVAPAGAGAESLEGVYGLRRGSREYVTAQVFKGSLSDPVPGFADVRGFTLVANPGEIGEKTVTIDLADMGARPRTLDAVIGFVNGKLEVAGITARLSRVALPRAADAKAGDPTAYALKLTGAAAEELQFTPLQERAGVTALTASGPAFAATARVTKIADEAAGDPLFSTTANGDPLRFKGNAETGFVARASAKGEDGALYVVGEATTPVDGGMGLRGSSDLTLTKFDAAGQRVWTRTLGASDKASGYGVAVGADGRVAVVGSFKGVAAGQTSQAESDGAVAMFDSDGDELWIRKIGGTGADEARAVAFAADGSLYVGGRTKSALSGANGGGWDGFVATFSASGGETARRQLADAGEGGVTAIATSAAGVFVAGSSNNAGFVRKLDTALADAWSSDVGALGAGGEITSIAASGGDVVIAGSVNGASIGLGGVETAGGGAGLNAFAARLTDGATPTTIWRRTFGGDLSDSAAAITIEAGAVYVASTEGVLKSDATTKTTRAVISRLDLTSGAQTWSRRIGNEGERAIGVAADAGGVSDLDAFGLPRGDLKFGVSSQPLVARTALRAGDTFSVRIDGGSARAIVIEATDTMKDLVTKLNGVLRSSGKAEVKTSNNSESLVITAADGRRINLVAGPAGKDALPVLGLSTSEAAKPKATSQALASSAFSPPVMPLNFRDDLAFSDAFSARKVRLDIERVQNAVRTAFEYIYNPPAPPKKANATAKPLTGAAAELAKSQLANYQAGLARLTPGSSDATTTNPTLSMFGLSI